MPRDGSGIYSQPFPDVVEGTTIESAVYNGFTHDVEIDLNTPRPISAGGTGATNPADAMSALGGEGSKIEVLNYDSHAFTAGSFYSKASATNPPVAAHAFAGICYVAVVSGIATSDMFIEVRDRDEATQPGSLYVRQKKNGTWSGWLKAVGTSMSGTPPASPTDGMFWWDPTRGKLFVWYSDPNTAQWVEAVAMPDMNPDDFVRIDAPQTLTPTQQTQARQNIYAAPFDAMAYNGMQINGSMEVSQESGTATVAVANALKNTLDGWIFYSSGAQTMNCQQIATGPAGFSYSNYASSAIANAAPAAGNCAVFFQRIEGWRVARLAWGTASAQPITIGFWVSAFRAGNYSGLVSNGAGNRSYVYPFTINAPSTWEYKIVTIPGDTTGTWAKDNTVGLTIGFTMMAGTTLQTAPNVWTAGGFYGVTGTINGVATTSDVMYITGVVVLPGIEAPTAARSPLIMRPYDQELVTCQRYLEVWDCRIFTGKYNFLAVGGWAATNAINANYQFRVRKRASPTFSWTGGFVALYNGGLSPINLSALSGAATTLDNMQITATAASAVARVGDAGMIAQSITTPAAAFFDARL